MNNTPNSTPKKGLIPVFDTAEIMPYGKIGKNIDWNRVFRDKIWIHHPDPINWNNAIDEQGNFDFNKFLMSRTHLEEDKAEYEKTINGQVEYITLVHTKHKDLDNIYITSALKKIITALQQMQNIMRGEKREHVKEQIFYNDLQTLLEQVESNTLIAGDNQKVAWEMLTTITENVQSALKWCEDQFSLTKTYWINSNWKGISQFINIDGTLKVDVVIAKISSHWTWNEDMLLSALYIAKCSRQDLEILQQGVIAALNQHMERLDTTKVFSILEFLLPYVFEGYQLSWKVEEIFDPAYLSHISIYDLTPEKFEGEVRTKWEKLGWSQEVQDRLIAQFKKYGTSESGGIGFGQGSEQLWYWNGVTGGINDNNLKHYTKSEEILEGDKKKPIPNILLPEAVQTARQKLLEVFSEENKR